MQNLSENMVDHIYSNIKPITSDENDRACWMPEISGEFIVKSAFQLVRRRKNEI